MNRRRNMEDDGYYYPRSGGGGPSTSTLFVVGVLVALVALVYMGKIDLTKFAGSVAPRSPAQTIVKPSGAQRAMVRTSGGAQTTNAQLPACSTVADPAKTACAGGAQPTPFPPVNSQGGQPGAVNLPDCAVDATVQCRSSQNGQVYQPEPTEVPVNFEWSDMKDYCEENGCQADPAAPTTQIPTECQLPDDQLTERGRLACYLIRKNLIAPKG